MVVNSRRAMFLVTAMFALGLLPFLMGQERPPADRAAVVRPVTPAKFVSTEVTPAKVRDLTRMTLQHRHFYLSAQRGTDWLARANKKDGRFVHGFLPAVSLPMEGDQYLRQVGAAWALGRGARFFGNENAAAIARQAVLTLLLETTTAGTEAKVRYTTPPSNLINRLATAGQLILAVHELPAPGKDLLDAADELGNFLQTQRQKDGSLAMSDEPRSAEEGAKARDLEAAEQFSGLALHGIIRSHAQSPAAWKIDCLRQARVHYQTWWSQKNNFPMVSGHTAAYAEAFAVTRDKAFAESVFAMNDWLCSLQYRNMDPRRMHWTGGFMPWVDGKAAILAPDIRSAAAAESLADACRTAKLAGDLGRHRRYKEALEGCLQFLTTLQYTEANTHHFAEWYRPLLVGGFHASREDGNLRIDYTQPALCALVQYLEFVAELP